MTNFTSTGVPASPELRLVGGAGRRPRRPGPHDEQVARGLARWLAIWAQWPDSPHGLRVGVACDCSQTMQSAERHLRSLSWAFVTGAKLAGWPPSRDPMPVQTAAVMAATGPGAVTLPDTAADDARPIPPLVCEGPSLIEEGIRIAASAAGLASAGSGTARLLVMITDAHELDDEIVRRAQEHIDGLRESGCGVLWLAPATNDVDFGVFPDVAVQVFEPDQLLIPDALGAAAADAMQRVVPARSQPQPVTQAEWTWI